MSPGKTETTVLSWTADISILTLTPSPSPTPSLIEKCASWCASILLNESTINYEIDEVMTLVDFPESF